MRIERIDSLDDPRVADYRNVKDGDLLKHHGLFMAEGEQVVRRLLAASRFPVRSLLLNHVRVEAMRDALQGLGEETPVFVAEQDVMDGIVGFHIHRGCLAAGERVPGPSLAEFVRGLGRGPGLVIVLEDLVNHDNVGAVFRNAAAFGADGVVLSPRCCDPLYRKAIRVSLGAALTMPFVEAPMDEAMGALSAAGFTTIALTPEARARSLAKFASGRPRNNRVALLLGTEGAGLKTRTIQMADDAVRIPMAPGADSLNVAAAAAVAMYELREQGASSGDVSDG